MFLSQQISAYKISLPEGKKHKKGVKTPSWRVLGREYYTPYFSREEAERKCNFFTNKEGTKKKIINKPRANREKNKNRS